MIFRPRRVDLLGLFPSFESAVFGGVQATGRQAWHALGTRQMRAEAFLYEQGAAKFPTVFRALRNRVRPDTLLVWHCGLLKLAPFIAPSPSRRVLFMHGIEVWRKLDPVTTRMMGKIDLFLTNSDHTWKRFGEFHPELAGAPHRTVHLGICDPLGEAAALPACPPAALMIGRMQRDEGYKGHREMIRIWPGVLVSMPDAELWIVGGGDLRPELEAIVQSLGLGSHIKFFGAVPDATKEDLIRRCRVLALPSAGEGFGLVYLEAMRMGRPCIVSRLDAGTEVVNPPEAGLSVDLADPAQTTAAVLELLASGPRWEQTSARAKRRYDSGFTASHFDARLLHALFNA